MTNWQVDRDSKYSVEIDFGPNYEWVAAMQWPEGETRGGPAVLVIYPSDPDACPPGGLSQTTLRDVDFKYALDRLRARLSNSKRFERMRQSTAEMLTSLLDEHAASGSITQEYLVLLSRVYVDAVKNGQAKPLDYLANLTGKSPAAVKNHLWQATRKGLLERSPGRAGGHLTDKGRAVLEPLTVKDGEALAKVGQPSTQQHPETS